MRSLLRVLAPATLGLLPAPAEPVTPAPTLTVYAAASLTDAFQELGRLLERRHPGLLVRFNFAGSQQLALQLEQGAPADVFASADQRWMSRVKEQGLLGGEPVEFARNRLVVVVPRANPARIRRLADLARPATKLVLAADAVPAGKYSRETLASLARADGFPGGYDRRVLANVVSEEENVRGVLAKVQLGEADAGMVYRSDVTAAAAPHVLVFDIPDPYNAIATYPIAVLRSAPAPEAAREFVALVIGDEGQAVLRRHGLLAAAAPERAAAGAHP